MSTASLVLLLLLLLCLWCLCWVVVMIYPRLDRESEIARLHEIHAEQAGDLLRDIYPYLTISWQDEITSLLIRQARENASVSERPATLRRLLDAH